MYVINGQKGYEPMIFQLGFFVCINFDLRIKLAKYECLRMSCIEFLQIGFEIHIFCTEDSNVPSNQNFSNLKIRRKLSK